MATIGNIDITNISLGDSEVSSISLGEIEIYSTGPTSPWRFVGLDNNLERASGTSVTCYGLYKYRGSDTDIEIPSEFNELPVRTIEANVFKDNDFIESVVIPDSIYELRESCFENAIVEDITFGDGIDYVGDKAFYGCSNLENVVLPDNQMTVGKAAFANCSSLQQIYLGNVVSLANDYDYKTFNNATGELVFGADSTVTDLGYYSLSGFKGTKLVLPNSLTSINSGALYDCSNLISLTVPFIGSSRKTASQTYRYPLGAMFGTYSFDGATQITQVYRGSNTSGTTNSKYYIPDSLREIIVTDCEFLSYGAFYNCLMLTDIVLPDNLLRIDGYVCAYCSNLTNLVLGSSLTTLDSGAFGNASGTGCLNVYYNGTIADWCNVTLGATSANPMNLRSNNNIFHTIDENGSAVYRNIHYSPVVNLVLPNNITTVKAYQFYKWKTLTSVTVPNNITSIGTSAFQECTNLIEVINYSSLTIAKNTSNGYVGYYSSIITTDPEYVSVIEVDNGLFIKYTNTTDNKVYLMKCLRNAPENLTIPNTYDVIQSNAFYGFDKITGITMTSGITTIDSYAFYQCTSLQNVTFSSDLTTIGADAFYGCTALTTLNASSSNNIQTVGDVAFAHCSSLTSFPASDNLVSIGNNAFTGCTSMTSLYLGNSITTLGQNIIANVPTAEIIWGDNLSITTLSAYTFSDYKGENLIIPNNITRFVNSWTTASAEGFTKLYYNGTLEEWCQITFDEVYSSPMNARSTITFYLLDENGDVEYQGNSYSKLINLVIPSTITSINMSQFNGFRQLETVYIPRTVTSIGRQAFAQSNAIFTFESGSTITSIGIWAFWGYGQSSITLPNSVTSIGECAFMDSKLTSLPTATGLTSIGDTAFANCYELTGTLIIPNNVTYIGNSAFVSCNNITEVVLPNGLTQIRSRVFENCTSLESIVIPRSVTSFGSSTTNESFNGCTNLTKVYYKGSIDEYCDINIYEYTNYTTYNVPTCYGADLYVADPNGSVEHLGTTYSLVTDVVIPDGKTSIRNSQFYGCKSIETITIPNSVTSIGQFCFGKCPAEIIWGDNPSITSLGSYSFYSYYGDSLTIPNSITTINNYAFKASKLTNIIIPNNVTSIGSNLFEQCTDLITVSLLCNITSIPQSTFYHCTSLESVSIPNSVTSIVDSAFSGCSSLESINIPENLTTIGNYAFYECSSLAGRLVLPEGVTSVGGTATFQGCSSLTSIVIPTTVTTLYASQFHRCSSLVSLTIPFVGNKAHLITDTNQYPLGWLFGTSEYTGGTIVTQQYHGSSASSTTSTSYYIPSSLRSVTVTGSTLISWGAFYNCSMLTDIVLSNTITNIDSRAFYNCANLLNINIPNSLTTIGDYAFRYCTKLTSYTLPNTITSIGLYAFADNDALTSINIPTGLTALSNYLFFDCSSLASITIPDNITAIGQYAFSNCSCIISWGVSPSITEIGEYAFNGYLGNNLPLPGSITTIRNYAFSYCSNLSYLAIPSTVTTITSNAFYYNLNSLARIDLLTTNTDTTYLNTVYNNISGATPIIYVKSVLMDKVLNELSWDPERVGCLDPISPGSITITNASSYQRKVFTLTAELNPIYANINNNITFSIISGNEYVTFDSATNTVAIHEGVENQTIRVRATTGLNNSVSDEKDITITYVDSLYLVTLDYHGAWEDSNTTIDGNTVYRSKNSYHIAKAYDTTRITITGYETFRFYVRSYGESCCDYIVVNNIDCSYVDTSSNIKMNTSGMASPSTYTEVVFNDLDGGEHFIDITYRKDGSVDSNDDRGYFYIPAQ